MLGKLLGCRIVDSGVFDVYIICIENLCCRKMMSYGKRPGGLRCMVDEISGFHIYGVNLLAVVLHLLHALPRSRSQVPVYINVRHLVFSAATWQPLA